MSEYETQVRCALGAIGVRPPGAYLWFGRRFDAGGDASLADAIAQRLRVDWLEPGSPRPASADPAAPAAEAASFARTLAQANPGRGSWQPGWRVVTVAEDEVAVVRPDGLVLLAAPQDCRIDGAVAEVRVPKDRAGLRPGVLQVLGDSAAPPAADRVRLSWNVAATGAITFVARASYALNGAGIPFVLELLDDPARYGRRPGANLLLDRSDASAAIALLRPLRRAIGAQMRDGVPALTKPIAHGIGIAEEPGGGESFGEHRCRLLAEAIVDAGDSADARLAAVRGRFADAQISLDAPYLQPGSIDAYDGS